MLPSSAWTMPWKEQPASPVVLEVCQQRAEVLTPIGGTPARLSLQFPGCPLSPLQRMMMLVAREPPAQKFLPAASPRHLKVPVASSKTSSALTAAAATRATIANFIVDE